MFRFWASLSGKVCETILMKKIHPSLLLSPFGMDASMSCVRSVVRQFLSFVFKQCSLYESDYFLRLRGRSLVFLSCYQGDQSIFRGNLWVGSL
jgi:hypothetical protein